VRRGRCENCVYAAPVVGGAAAALVCANSQALPGQLRFVEPKHLCSRYILRRLPSRRRTKIRNQPADPTVRFIPLTRGKVAIVDAEDFPRLNKYTWSAHRRGRNRWYAYGSQPDRTLIAMHRLILNAPKNRVVDHIDRNSLNNTKRNLRLCTQAQNCCNRIAKHGTSRFKGVHWSKTRKRWIARIKRNGKSRQIGSFENEIEAAKAYDREARRLFGRFAWLNFGD